MNQIHSSRSRWVFGLLLVAATVLAYWPALHGGFIWDDDVHITANETLRTWRGLWDIWFKPGATSQYYPLSFTGFWIGYHLWGLDTFGYHLQNVLLHGVAAVLLWRVLACLRVPGALLAGAIFALHPVNVMSVAWMTELKNTLSCTLALGSVWAYMRFAGLGEYDSGGQSGDGRGAASRSARRYYILSLFLFVLAMFAKTAASFLPVTLFLILWWQRDRLTRRDLAPLIPIFGIAGAMGALTIYIEHHSGSASGAAFNLSLPEKLLVSGRSFWFYLGKLIYPRQLTFIYERWRIDSGVWWQYLYPLAAAALLAGLWLARKRLGKGIWVAAMHFYVSTSMLILMVVLYMMQYSFVSDHWQYFGSMSVIGLAAAGIAGVLGRYGLWATPSGNCMIMALLALLGVLTWRQTEMYADIETLWRTTIARNPQCWMAHNNLGLVLFKQGRTGEAIPEYRAALRINPADTEAHNNVGIALFQQGQPEEAISEYRDALRIDPGFAEAHNNLGVALLRQGKSEEAVAEIREALRIDPAFAEAHKNLGNFLLQHGQIEEAVAQYAEAVRINPTYGEAYYGLGNALLQGGRAGEGIDQIQRSLELLPGNLAIRNKLAWVLATAPQTSLRNGARAVQLATQASQSSGGGNPVILRTLAAAYAEDSQFPNAVQTAQRALQLAQAQSDIALAGALRQELMLYEAGRPFETAP